MSFSRILYPCWDWRCPNTRWAWLGPWCSSSFQHPSLPYWVHSLNGRMTWNPYTSHLENFLSPSCPLLCLPGWVGPVWVWTVACLLPSFGHCPHSWMKNHPLWEFVPCIGLLGLLCEVPWTVWLKQQKLIFSSSETGSIKSCCHQCWFWWSLSSCIVNGHLFPVSLTWPFFCVCWREIFSS